MPAAGAIRCVLATTVLAVGAIAQGAEDEPTPDALPEASAKDLDAFRARQRARHETRVAAHFQVCDLDENGWVSFREAAATLGIEKRQFKAYDADGDGRVDPEEFRIRYQTILSLLGAIPEPSRPESEDGPSPTELEPPIPVELVPSPVLPPVGPTPRKILRRYDADGGGGLGEPEIHAFLEETAPELSANVLLEQGDRDRTGELEEGELAALVGIVSRRFPARRPPSRGGLFPVAEPRELPEGSPPLPPVIRGPATHFRRLDLDGDGRVDAEDLRVLLAPARSGVRPSAVVAALDRDGDGRLSEAEFRRALGGD